MGLCGGGGGGGGGGGAHVKLTEAAQAQYHGEVAFARHVERLVLPKAVGPWGWLGQQEAHITVTPTVTSLTQRLTARAINPKP